MKNAPLFLVLWSLSVFLECLCCDSTHRCTEQSARMLLIKARRDSFTKLVRVSVRLEMRMVIDHDDVPEALGEPSLTCPVAILFTYCWHVSSTHWVICGLHSMEIQRWSWRSTSPNNKCAKGFDETVLCLFLTPKHSDDLSHDTVREARLCLKRLQTLNALRMFSGETWDLKWQLNFGVSTSKRQHL